MNHLDLYSVLYPAKESGTPLAEIIVRGQQCLLYGCQMAGCVEQLLLPEKRLWVMIHQFAQIIP